MIVNNGAFVLVFLFSCHLRFLRARLDTEAFDEKMLALIKVLEYMRERPQQMNVDTTFGATFAEVNLQAALQHSNVISLEAYEKDFLAKTWLLAQNTRNVLYENEKLSSEETVRLSAGVNRPEIWLRPMVWKQMLSENRFSPDPNLTIGDVVKSMFRGHPEADESDRCLLDLIDDCELSDRCRVLVTSDNSSSTTGYPLTHRLLIKQTASALQCNTSISRFSPYIGYNLCYLILRDLMTLEATGFPDISKDLALEEIFLCGMEGYLDFLSDHYEQLVLDWQHESGCYRGFGESRVRRKRSGSFTDFGCINHTTGLAAATLALMIRKDVETMGNP